VTSYPLAADQNPGWAGPAAPGRDVLAARAALTDGLRALRETVQLMHTDRHRPGRAAESAFARALGLGRLSLGPLGRMDSVSVRGDGNTAPTRTRPHTNEAPSRHQPGGNTKPIGTGRTGNPGRQVTPAESSDHIGLGASATPGTTVTEPGTGPGFPSRPDLDDPAREVWNLVERAQNGDTEAFGLIYDRYMDTVFRFIYFRVGNRQLAEDLTSDTFLRALKRIGSFTWQGRDLGAWLVTIARNLVADHFKSGRYRLEVTTGDVLDAEREDRGIEGSPESAVVDHITNVTLLTAVKQLNPEQQECIVLRFLQGFSVAETAQAMGKNEGAIKALQYRAVRALARLLPDGFQR
jgi:RNA polymerase sigma-70 factor, ECF subfamily